MSINRVYFYSVHDLACYRNMELAEKVLANFSESNNYNINDIIELYQVKLYIDNEVFLSKWSKQDIEEIKEKVKKIWSVIVKFWNKINTNNISELFSQLECWTLQDSFWELTSNLSIYKSVERIDFGKLLQLKECNIRAILCQEKVVRYFDKEIRDFLLTYNKAAELLLSQYVEKHDRQRNDFIFPKCLSIKDKEDIISKYLDQDDTNLNFVRLALNIKKSDNIDISDRTRLKAKRLEEKLNNEILEKNTATLFGIQVEFNEYQLEPFSLIKDGSTDVLIYSTKHILSIDNPLSYLAHFVGLFFYLDNQGCISMVSKNSEFSVLEKIFMKSKNEYPIGPIFYRKETISLAQIFIYDNFLKHKKKQDIEELIHFYIINHLNNCFGLNGFRFNLPSTGISYFERIRTLLAEYDVLLRQYKLFKEDGEIDVDLLCMSSNTYSLSQIPSFIEKKYCYLHKDKLALPLYLLFSDQSGLSYVEPFKESKYHCLYDLILNERVSYSSFEQYQSKDLNQLIETDYLFVDHSGFVRFNDENQIFILRQLYKEEVLSYWHYSDECRGIMDKMVDDEILYFESTLFNKLEQSYFNYYLNKKEFTNGLDLRNSFMHGTNPDSENELKNLYYVLLRIIVLTILKIDDDQVLKLKFKK